MISTGQSTCGILQSNSIIPNLQNDNVGVIQSDNVKCSVEISISKNNSDTEGGPVIQNTFSVVLHVDESIVKHNSDELLSKVSSTVYLTEDQSQRIKQGRINDAKIIL